MALVEFQICNIYYIVANVSMLRVGIWFQTMGDIEIAICGVEAILVAQHDSMTARQTDKSRFLHPLNKFGCVHLYYT